MRDVEVSPLGQEPPRPIEQPSGIGAEMSAVTAAVAALPALPPADPRDRYGPRPVTVTWLLGRPQNTRRAYYRDLVLWLTYCDGVNLDPLAARRADADAWAA
ncbi:MAG: hypothetical protein ACRDTQ_10990, partial [Micromonosporaceae bacterium]